MSQQIWKTLGVGGLLALTLHLCSQRAIQQGAMATEETASFREATVIRAPKLPARLTFAGEPVPLEVPDVAERLDRELLTNSYLQATTLLGLKRMQRYLPQIKQLLVENDVPEDFVYLALAESLFSHVTSPAGASGFWQLMPDTARGYGLLVNAEVDERYHLEKATRAACRYLKTAKKKFGTWTNAAASYNRGMAGLDAALKRQRVDSFYDLFLNDETSRYLFRILALKEILGNPEKYGFDLPEAQGYAPHHVRTLTVTSTIPDLPQYALDQGTNYKTLKLYNPWIKSYKLTVTAGKEYELALPK
ncbi:lytic transglycosylase domain-containing protein [Rufibacter quisquiliarum]|uniref:Transglycosylase SLT domain-containing protein n=1 Tax=Rufibacter quisquiliarum TaxID=1549639 RepID=A0A839GGH4_9BACT|nr:hypothetical protein [Rufibacter quisquiliarum]